MYTLRETSSRRISCFLQVFLLFSGLLNCLQWGAVATYLPKTLAQQQQMTDELDNENVNNNNNNINDNNNNNIRYPIHEELKEFLHQLDLLGSNFANKATEDETDADSAERMKKFNPYTFHGTRGKRLNANTFMGSRGKKLSDDEKRNWNPNAFVGSRGKRLLSLLGERSQLNDLTYLSPMMVRQDRRMNPLAFGPTRGKRHGPTDFVGSRGKKSELEDIVLNSQNDSPKEIYERRASLHTAFIPSRGKRSA
ncbi:uncharacterized protein LOC115229488 [Argonauta hians]